MKKYYINIRNDKRISIYVWRTALAIYMAAITVGCWLVHPLTGIMWTILFAFCLLVSFNSIICDFTNYFTYNPETNEITLKRFRQRDRVINLSSVEKIVEKSNPDPFLGACSRKHSTSCVVKSRDGYDYFFIEQNDAVLEKFFADHGIPTLPVREESTD